MPPIRSLASERYTCTTAVIFLFSKIMPSCFYCIEKKLVYIIIMALSSHQPSFYVKYTKLNIYSSCDIRSVSNIKYL